MAQGILVLTCAADGKRHRKSQGHQSPADPEINQPSTQQRNSVIKESSRNKRWGTIKQRFWEEWMGVYMARKLYDKMKTRLIWNARKSNCYIIYIFTITSQTYPKTRYFRTVEIIQFNKHLWRIYYRQIAIGVTNWTWKIPCLPWA